LGAREGDVVSEGRVVIVGAGPGAADLLTVRAAQALGRAQVVLHDDLVSPDVMALCPESACLINVGKRCGQRGSSQEEINALMVEHAHAGRTVVRLKSGDPSVFGRLGEELDALRKAAVGFEVIPGVTAAAAAAAAAEITLTDRRLASTLVVLSGHNAQNHNAQNEDETRRRPAFDLERTTLAVYMPGPDYGRTARELMGSGISADTPCVLVSNAGRREQQVRFLTLEGLGALRGIVPPAVVIVGEVARRKEFSEILEVLAKQPAPIRTLESPAHP
jgi:uroporphyrin-III C-methyltransferase / precorrin-2 dehydrogenase / sirohydrochlorin ferrochelatase